MNHNIKIDWLSFSGYTGGVEGSPPKHYYKAVARHLIEQYGDVMEQIFHVQDWTHGGGRRPYAHSMRTERGITIWYDPRAEWCLMEISGQGCDWLRENGLLERLAGSAQERVTRLDIAIDYETNVTPSEVFEAGYSPRIKSTDFKSSPSGETVYLGARQSELLTRIYRYSEPHPRSRFLRIEHELKGDRAKFFTQVFLRDGLDVCRAMLDRNRGFEHPMIELSTLDTTLTQQKGRQSEGNTIRWLHTQVVPAIATLYKEGVVEDIHAFLNEEIYPAVMEKLYGTDEAD